MYKKITLLTILIILVSALPTQAQAGGPPDRQIYDAPDFFWFPFPNPCYQETLTVISGTVQVFEIINNNVTIFHSNPLSQILAVGNTTGYQYIFPGVLHIVEMENGDIFIHNGVMVVPSLGATRIIQNGICH
jgi:hypothetical protein